MTEAIFGHDRLDVYRMTVECTAEIRRPMLLLWLPQRWIMKGDVVLHRRDEPANPRERRTTRGLKWNLVRQPPRDPRTTVMNPQLDSLIQRFRDAQDAGVRALTEQLRIPKPASNLEWPTMCLDHKINRRCRLNEIDVHTHGYGVELKIGDLTIDFDWGENGEPDGFDAWRLYKFTLDNGGSDSYSHNRIQEWIDRSFAAGELTKSGTLYYDPKRRAKAPIQHANKSEISDERDPE